MGLPSASSHPSPGESVGALGVGVIVAVVALIVLAIAAMIATILLWRRRKLWRFRHMSNDASDTRSLSRLTAQEPRPSRSSLGTETSSNGSNEPVPHLVPRLQLDKEDGPVKLDLAGQSPTVKHLERAGTLFSARTLYIPQQQHMPPAPLNISPVSPSVPAKKLLVTNSIQSNSAQFMKKSGVDVQEPEPAPLYKSKSVTARIPEKISLRDAVPIPTAVATPAVPVRTLGNPQILGWSSQQVADALVASGVSTHHVDLLRENEVNGYSLLLLNDGRLKEMGVEPQSGRLLLLTAINLLRANRTISIQSDAPPQYS
ncbi:hypothetical protein HDU97_010091 [Phlyctochytrium planicorne]|nr:hypothetical protein HDU97_010091 [Phlyctochytrium planicorne]